METNSEQKEACLSLEEEADLPWLLGALIIIWQGEVKLLV